VTNPAQRVSILELEIEHLLLENIELEERCATLADERDVFQVWFKAALHFTHGLVAQRDYQSNLHIEQRETIRELRAELQELREIANGSAPVTAASESASEAWVQ
jgi:hypothetical protein